MVQVVKKMKPLKSEFKSPNCNKFCDISIKMLEKESNWRNYRNDLSTRSANDELIKHARDCFHVYSEHSLAEECFYKQNRKIHRFSSTDI